MYVCICKAVTDKQIREAAESGVSDMLGLQRELGVATGCGSCSEAAAELLNDAKRTTRVVIPSIYRPALA